MKHIHLRTPRILALSTILVVLCGCGQKGALYLADEQQPVNPPAQTDQKQDTQTTTQKQQ